MSEGVDRLGRLYGWTAEERDHVAALVAEARDTFAAADSEQRRLAEWVLANCPGEPSQDGGVVDTVIRLITSARADGAAEERAKWKWLEDAQIRLAGKYTYAPGPGGNLDRIARLSAEDLRPVVEEWIKSHYRAMDAARGIPS